MARGGHDPENPDRRWRRDFPSSVLIAIAVVCGLVALAYLALVWRLAELGQDVSGWVRFGFSPTEFGTFVGVIIASILGGKAVRRSGRAEALAGDEGATQVKEKIDGVQAEVVGVAELLSNVGPLLEEVAPMLEQYVVDRAREQAEHRAPTGVTQAVGEPTLAATGQVDLYLTAVPPDAEAIPLPSFYRDWGERKLAELEHRYDDPRSQ